MLCGGFGEDELEVLAEAVERAANTPSIPFAIISQDDVERETTLKEVLQGLRERDRRGPRPG